MTLNMESGLLTPLTRASSPSEYPPTPSEGIHFTPKRAMASFDNLVALANHQERLRGARKMVWRDRGEPVAELNTLRECLEHAAAGGIRGWFSWTWVNLGLKEDFSGRIWGTCG